MKKSLSWTLACGLWLAASATPGADVDALEPSRLPGFWQAIVGGQLVFVSADGRYALNGNALDIERHEALGETALAEFRKAELAKVPADEKLVFAPAHPKHVVRVFTDVTCGYCRLLHEHMADYNRAGIAVEYLAWPRSGVNTTAGRPTPVYTEMVSVWCAKDPKAAFGAAIEGQPPAAAECRNPVARQHALGRRLGVNGTPFIFDEHGNMYGGYLPPERLLEALELGR